MFRRLSDWWETPDRETYTFAPRERFRRWWIQNALLVGAGILLATALLLGVWLMRREQHDIEMCMRAFDYTREQCSIIIRYHVKP